MSQTKDINSFRAPMVTAIGIIFGFVLAYMGDWVTDPTTHRHDWLVTLGFALGISLLLIALYRILNHAVSPEQEAIYYARTLKIFMSGMVCSFLGVLLATLQQLL
ncbi:MAG: hypothetical protein Q4E16_01820 [Neisseria sp.]|nr:hypothetical protein [Neisseria sp.]